MFCGGDSCGMRLPLSGFDEGSKVVSRKDGDYQCQAVMEGTIAKAASPLVLSVLCSVHVLH